MLRLGFVAFTYKDLEAWQLAMRLVEDVYKTTAGYPRTETYGMVSQTRRAAVSIPSNLAEGHCRRSTNAYANHVSIALGSHGELCTLLEISRRLEHLSLDQFLALTRVSDSVGRLLYGLHNSLDKRRA